MNGSYKAYSAVVLAILGLLGLFAAAPPQRDFSENENRYLEKIPKADFDGVMSGKFQEKTEKALSDQMPMRDFMAGASTSAKKLLGLKDAGGVYFAKDGYYIAKTTDRDISKKTFVENLRYVDYFAKEAGGQAYVMLVPPAGRVLDEKLPAYAPFYDVDAAYDVAGAMLGAADVIDLRDAFEQQKSSQQIFFRTDHHWTLQGAYAAYEQYCLRAGLKKHSYGSFSPGKVVGGFYGTLYSKTLDFSAKPDEIYAISESKAKCLSVSLDGRAGKGVYDRPSLKKKDKYAYFFGGNYGKVDIKTYSGAQKSLLVIKDSFANCFVPFLLGDYSSITMLDLRYYNGPVMEMAKEGGYDDVLVLYEIGNFANDANIRKMAKMEG